MLSPAQRAEFAARGLIALPRHVGRQATTQAREALLAELERLGLRTQGRWHLRRYDRVPAFQVAARIAQALPHLPAFDAALPPDLHQAAQSLAGGPLVPSQRHPSLLVTPPQRGPWAVPHQGWHVDVAAAHGTLPGVQAFVLLGDVAPEGGATVVLAGSHRVAATSGGLHQALHAHPFFRGLFDARAPDRHRLLALHPLGDIPLQVVPLAGRAGDTFLMDMRVLHAPSLNATSQPRLALTQRFVRPTRT